jgi:hypothetical protein
MKYKVKQKNVDKLKMYLSKTKEEDARSLQRTDDNKESAKSR